MWISQVEILTHDDSIINLYEFYLRDATFFFLKKEREENNASFSF